MRIQLIEDFIENNPPEKQKEYNDYLLTKLKDTSDLNNKVSLYMIALVVLYFFFKSSTIKDVDLSFMKIEKFDIIAQLTPPVFALLLLYYMIINAHRAEMIQFSRILTYGLYKNTIESIYTVVYAEANTFARLIQPFSFWLEMSKWDVNGKASFGDALLRLPVILVLLLPFIFLFYSLKVLCTQYWDLTLSKYALIFSLWILTYTIYSFCRTMMKNYRWIKEGAAAQP